MDIRRATIADAEAIRQIYNIEVTGSTATLDLVPRSSEKQLSWMAAHSGVYPVIVVQAKGAVVGFASLSPYRPRPGYATAVEDSIYVASDHRGQGVGRELLSQAVDMARTHGFHSVVARVSATQQAWSRSIKLAGSTSSASNARSAVSSAAGSMSRSCNCSFELPVSPSASRGAK